MRDYTKYDIWKEGKALVIEVYNITRNFPVEEKFGLISQIRRCSISIPSNIAEGASRETDKEFKRFLTISLGSLFELETQLLISIELGFTSMNNINELLEKLNILKKKIINLMKKLIA